MLNANKLFDEVQRKQIEQAVASAEAKTSCEIVPVVATRSGRYDRPEDIVGLWFAVIAGVVVWLLMPRHAADAGSWAASTIAIEIVVLVASLFLAFIIGAVVGSRVGVIGRLFTPKQQMADEVNAKARQVFFDSRVHHTAGATGLLIFVSLFEHIAVVLADKDVLEKIGQQAIDNLCNQLTIGLHEGKYTEALSDVIAAAGELLEGPLPRQGDDVNELADVLVLVD